MYLALYKIDPEVFSTLRNLKILLKNGNKIVRIFETQWYGNISQHRVGKGMPGRFLRANRDIDGKLFEKIQAVLDPPLDNTKNNFEVSPKQLAKVFEICDQYPNVELPFSEVRQASPLKVRQGALPELKAEPSPSEIEVPSIPVAGPKKKIGKKSSRATIEHLSSSREGKTVKISHTRISTFVVTEGDSAHPDALALLSMVADEELRSLEEFHPAPGSSGGNMRSIGCREAQRVPVNPSASSEESWKASLWRECLKRQRSAELKPSTASMRTFLDLTGDVELRSGEPSSPAQVELPHLPPLPPLSEGAVEDGNSGSARCRTSDPEWVTCGRRPQVRMATTSESGRGAVAGKKVSFVPGRAASSPRYGAAADQPYYWSKISDDLMLLAPSSKAGVGKLQRR